MSYIKAYIDYDDETKAHYYEDFKIVERLPEVEEKFWNDERIANIEEVELDCENDSKVYDYDFYVVTYETKYDDEIEKSKQYICIRKEEE